MAPQPTNRSTSAKPKGVTLDPDVALWVAAILFPPPDSGRAGAIINGIPGNPDFEAAVDLFNRARTQLGG